MSRIHPSDQNNYHLLLNGVVQHQHPTVLTVWKRSSTSFQGTDGFTVFYPNGRLIFRVDNYSRKNDCGLVLMDGLGNALLTLKPKILSMQCHWNAFLGEAAGPGCVKTKLFSMRSPSLLLFNSTGNNYIAEIFMEAPQGVHQNTPDFKIEGSFRSRECKIVKIPTGQVVAKLSRKRVKNTTILLSNDVFSLVVQPDFDTQLIMAFVIVLDRLTSKPFAPLLCS